MHLISTFYILHFIQSSYSNNNFVFAIIIYYTDFSVASTLISVHHLILQCLFYLSVNISHLNSGLMTIPNLLYVGNSELMSFHVSSPMNKTENRIALPLTMNNAMAKPSPLSVKSNAIFLITAPVLSV